MQNPKVFLSDTEILVYNFNQNICGSKISKHLLPQQQLGGGENHETIFEPKMCFSLQKHCEIKYIGRSKEGNFQMWQKPNL